MTSNKKFEDPSITALTPEGLEPRDQKDIETLTRQGRVIAKERDCTFCLYSAVCSDTDGKKRISSVCEADFW